MRIIGYRNMSDDIESYMKSVEEKEKIDDIISPDNQSIDTHNSDSNIDSVTILNDRLDLGVMNMSKAELSSMMDKINNKQDLGKIQANAHMVESVARTRMKELKRNG